MHLDPGWNAEQRNAAASLVDIAGGAIAAGEEDEGAALPRHHRRGCPGVLGTCRRPGTHRDDGRRKTGSQGGVLAHCPGSDHQVETIIEAQELGQSTLCPLLREGHGAAAARRGEDRRTVGTLEADRTAHSRDRVDDQSEAPAMIASHSISTR